MDEVKVIEKILERYSYDMEFIKENKIDLDELLRIYEDYIKLNSSYESQAEFIANILRTSPNVHTVKTRIKEPDRLIEKIIRKTQNRREKYGENFNFTVENYKDEINDILGIRVIHILKDEWQTIHNFIKETWNVIEITANVRDGDNTEIFKKENIEIRSRQSGYRSVHYLVETLATKQKLVLEIQVRTIFEEGYGEIDHRLRYSNTDIPEIIKTNLLLFNRIIGSADEMASLINELNNEFDKEEYYRKKIDEKDQEILELKKKLKDFNYEINDEKK
ncbi:MAG: RelA/SpoT domain-containing protein [Sarcina sp.]